MHTYFKNYSCRRRGRGPEEEEVNPGNYSGSGEKLKKKKCMCVENREHSYAPCYYLLA